MNQCPLTYESCGKEKYSIKGLKSLSRALTGLNDFPYTPKEQVLLAAKLAAKLSIQGIQPKLSVVLNVQTKEFEIVEKGGVFILKPPHQLYEQVPQNEDLTMRLAKSVEIEVPFHGMIYNIDGSLSYIIKRFDRLRKQKVGVEDFTQLLGGTRDTKYDSSMEKVVSVIEKHCSFPVVEKRKLFRRVLFNFLVGNEDMHLKNFMLIKHQGQVSLSPAYDLLNTTILMQAKEEIALPLRGKKSRLTKDDFFMYFGKERMGLEERVLREEGERFERVIPFWQELISRSFLSKNLRDAYKRLLLERWTKLTT